MASESLTIDPTSEDATNVAYDFVDSANGKYLRSASYPAPERDLLYASSADTEGEVVANQRYKNRRITVTHMVQKSTAALLDTAVDQLQQKVGKLQREGGTLKRTTVGGNVIVFDVVDCQIDVPLDFFYEQSNVAKDITVEFEAKPFGRGAAVTLADNTETTLPCIVFTVADVAGDVPALGKLVVDEDDGDDQFFGFWGLRSRHYNAGTTHELFYKAEELLPLGGAVAGAGSSGFTVVRQGTLTTSYQAMLSTAYAAGTVHQQHIGDYNVWARLWRLATNSGTVSVALEWGEGDFRRRTTNSPVVFDADDREGVFTLTKLGQVHLSEVAQGAQRWEGRLLAKSSTAGDHIEVDSLFLQPVGEGSGEIRGVEQFETATSFSARSEFNTESEAITGDSLAVGGTWAGAGDADDFSAASGVATRTAVSDGAGYQSGRFAIAGTTTFTSIVSQVDVKMSALSANAYAGPFARYTNTDNWFLARWHPSDGDLEINKRVAGTTTPVFTESQALIGAADTWFTIRLRVDSAGRWQVWLFATGSDPGEPLARGHDSALATGGSLASGRVGMWDYRNVAGALTRDYDNFLAFVPTTDAAIFASQSLEIRHDRVIREDSTGTIWTPVSKYEGDYLYVPAAGREDRTSQIIVKFSRNDPDTMADTGIDDISARLTYTPRYLVVPD